MRLLTWFSQLDQGLLELGIIRKIRKKRAVDFEAQLRKRHKEAEKQHRRDERRRIADQRDEIKRLQALERAENKQEVRRRQEAEIQLKHARRLARDEQRIARANRKLNEFVHRGVARDSAHRARRQKKAQKELEDAKEKGRDTLVNLEGEGSKFKLWLAPKRAMAEAKLPTGYGVFGLTCAQHERLDDLGVQTPIQQPDYTRQVRLDVTPQSNGSKSTRSAAAVKAREERAAELKRVRDLEGHPLPIKLNFDALPAAKRARGK